MNYKIIQEDLEEIYSRNIAWEKLKNKTIFISGAYGMLASYIVFMCIYLNEKWDYNICIIAAVRCKQKLEKRFGKYIHREYFQIYEKSITEEIELTQDVDYIVHAAGLASSQFYFKIPVEVMLPNVLGTIRLLELAEKKPAEGFLLFSSGEVYGKVDPEINIINEDIYGKVNTLDIRNCYCESKRMAEMLCMAWNLQKKVPVKIARICHTYGPTMDIQNDKRVFAEFVSDILNDRDIHMKGNGKTKRPFTYIADAAAGYFKILLEGEQGSAYNVCNEKEFLSIKQLADVLIHIYPEKGLHVICEMPLNEIKNETENEILISSEKLQKMGWECKYSTRTGFYRTIEALKKGI